MITSKIANTHTQFGYIVFYQQKLFGIYYRSYKMVNKLDCMCKREKFVKFIFIYKLTITNEINFELSAK